MLIFRFPSLTFFTPVTTNEDYVIEILLDSGLITNPQIERAKAAAASNRSTVVKELIDQGAVTMEDVTRSLAAHSSMDFVDLSQMTVVPEVIGLIPGELAWRFRVIPVAQADTGLTVATGNPLDYETFDTLGFLLKRPVEFVSTTPEQIQTALVKYYGDAKMAGDLLASKFGEVGGADTPKIEGVDEDGGDAPIIKMVTMLLLEAYKSRASDIHLEPLEKRFRIRFRIDGELHEMQNPPKKLQSAITSRLKIMTGSMSIAEKRLPQDGRIQVKIGKNSIDLRVSTIPTNHGEGVVMRILDKSSLTLGLPELGFLSDDQELFERLIVLPDGIILVTGPTGSGKSTTLYACLNYINKPDRKIITVEDPRRIPDERDQPGAGECRYRHDIPGGLALHAAPGAEYHHDR